jgi:putative ABC transport system permease protein
VIRRLQEALSRVVAMIRAGSLDRDFDDELSAHLDLLTARHQRQGLSYDEARRRAIRQMGGIAATRELHHDARGIPRVEQWIKAMTQAWRSWRSAKAVALLAAGALAIGIGSATSIYTVVNAVMLKPLPYRDGGRFVALFAGTVDDSERYDRLTSPDVRTYADQTQVFDAFGWFREAGKNLTYAGEPHHIRGVTVTPSLVRHLGVDPVLGRWFEDDQGAVISRALWQRLRSDPGIIGRTLTLDGRPYVVTGVMPEWFHFPVAGITSEGFRADVWMGLDPQDPNGGFVAYGRTRPDVTFAAAEADVNRVARAIAAEAGASRPGYVARLFNLRETVIRDVRPTLLLLFAAAGLLFLIACANAAGLLLARSVARARETAVRVALGGRGQLAVHYFAEGLLVSLAGAAGGVLLSVTLTPAIVAMAASYLPRAEDVAVDWTVLLFTLAAACLAAVIASVAPLWQAMRTPPAEVLGSGLRTSAGARTRRLSHGLVIAETALAFSLLAVSALLIVHVRTLASTPPGFGAESLLSFRVSVPGPVASDLERRVTLQSRVVDALSVIPGVERVALANQLPFKDCCWEDSIIPDGTPAGANAPRVTLTAISSGYFDAMRIPVRNGRVLTDHDFRPGTIAVVINETAAKQYWRGRDPIGASGRIGGPNGGRFEVVGVTGDVRGESLRMPAGPEVYWLAFYPRVEGMSVVMRSARSEASLMTDVRRVIKEIDPELPIYDVISMPEIIRGTMTLERTASFLTAFFAGAALAMAMLAVFGVMSYSVQQRTVEIGTRIALGASRRSVLSLIIGRGLAMASAGVVAGGMVALGATLYVRQVFQIGVIGPAPFLYSIGLVAAMALVASAVPALRATLLSPLVAMRGSG